jgi:iron complex transport system substrate-binding protein
LTNKYVTYATSIVAIVAILSAAFIYISYSGQVTDLQSEVTGLQGQVTTLQNQLNSQQQQPTQESFSVVDDEGHVTTFDSVPQRLISLAPSTTQMLFALGVGDKVVGVTDYDDYPYNFSAWIEAGNMTSVGGYSTPNMEAIATLQPDLILATSINSADVVTMRSLGYNVIVTNPTSINGVYQDISMIGRATGAEETASDLITSISTQISNIATKIADANLTENPTVYYEVWYDPSYLMSAGSASWINDVIDNAGGVNIFGDVNQQYPTTSSEVIVQKNPDVILLPTDPGSGMAFYGSIDDVKARPGWNTISAVQNDHVYTIDEDLFSVPGPRIGDQVQAVAECLYPQLFNSSP